MYLSGAQDRIGESSLVSLRLFAVGDEEVPCDAVGKVANKPI